VALVQVDVVGAQTAQRGVELREDLLAGQATAAVGHRPEELRGEDVRVAGAIGEHLAEEFLRLAARVHVRGVDEVDADLERLRDARFRSLAPDAAALGQPGAERELGHHQVARAEPPLLHDADANG
jgi:hypothetical protein